MSWRKLASVWASASALARLLIIAAGISFLFFLSMAALTDVNAGPMTSPSVAPAGVEPAPCFATPDDGVTVFNTVDSVTYAPTVTLSAKEALKPSAVFMPEVRTTALQ